MEAAEAPRTAENVANYFKTVDASSHWCIDNNSRVRVVPDEDAAWTLPPLNSKSLNIELAGYARQTAADWADDYSIQMLELAALSSAEWVNKYGIPIRRLSDSQIRNGEKGFAGHVDVNRVFKKSSHWDPGPAFPWNYFLDRVRAHVLASGGKAPASPQPQPQASAGYDNLGFSTAYIKNIQTLLNALGYNLAVDGKRGPASKAAILDFQKKNGLDQDASPGPLTKAKLEQVITGKKVKVRPNCTALQAAVRAKQDNSWGPDTEKRLDTLREASRWGGQDFPYGVKFAQEVVGTAQDGSWGPKSVRAHDATVIAVQHAIKNMGFDPGPIDQMWDPSAEAAYQSARRACSRIL